MRCCVHFEPLLYTYTVMHMSLHEAHHCLLPIFTIISILFFNAVLETLDMLNTPYSLTRYISSNPRYSSFQTNKIPESI